MLFQAKPCELAHITPQVLFSLKRIRAKARTKVLIVWPMWNITSSTSLAKRYLCTAYTAGFLHYQLFISMDRPSRSQLHDATRQFVQIGYWSLGNLDSSPQVSLVFQECSRPLCQSLPEASMNRQRQRDLRTSTASEVRWCYEALSSAVKCLLGEVFASWKAKKRRRSPLGTGKEGDPLFCALLWIAWICYWFHFSLCGCPAAYAKCYLEACLLSGVCLLRVTFSR